jgi:hypothetical protein
MGGLFGGGGDAPPPPPPPKPPAPMPDDQSPLVKEAGRRRMADFAGRGGRSSTILSQDEGSNEEQSYSKQKLG